MMRPRIVRWSLLIALLGSCRPAAAPNESRVERAPATSPSELLTDDLDIVVRIDAARIRQNPALANVVRDLAKTQPSELLSSVESAFADAAAVWVGTRWMSDGFYGDGIVAIEVPPGGGRFVLSEKEARSWRALHLASREVEAFERPSRARGEAVLRVVMDDRGLVLATAAEADAVLRVLGTWPDPSRLDPPARGLVSFAGRMRGSSPIDAAVARGKWQSVAEGLVGYAGSLDEASDPAAQELGGAIDLEIALTYATSVDAARAAERAKTTAERLAAAVAAAEREGVGGDAEGGPRAGAARGTPAAMSLGAFANSLKLTEIGASLQVRAKVPFAWLAQLH